MPSREKHLDNEDDDEVPEDDVDEFTQNPSKDKKKFLVLNSNLNKLLKKFRECGDVVIQ